jgi:hypothetical protein
MMTHQDLQLKKNVKKPIGILRLQNLTLSFSKKHFLTNDKLLLTAFGALEKLAGSKCKGTVAIKSISDFKLRSGQLIGCKINVCGYQGHAFIDRLITQVLPANSDQYLKNNKKLAMPANFDNSLVSKSDNFGRDIFEIQSSFADYNRTYRVHGFPNLSLRNRRGDQNLFWNNLIEAINTRPIKSKSRGEKIAVISLNLSDPFQSCELEDNFEIFENVDCIELRLTISLEKPNYHINYSSFFI